VLCGFIFHRPAGRREPRRNCSCLRDLTDAQRFTAKRRAIRAALAEDGIAAEIEALVDALLPP
jgi:hypothetical protein